MLVLAGAGVLTVALALHVAWVAKRAQAKGRSAAAWIAIALVLAGAGLRVGIALFLRAAELDSDVLMAVFATADQESVRIAWDGGELLILPTGAPATREGRMQQARTIAARLPS